jgi:pimeloyl-ACP methyl ester carboxylesterase
MGIYRISIEKARLSRTTASDAVAVLDALDVPTATVTGHSMGGFVALVLADRHPERVDRLLSNDGYRVFAIGFAHEEGGKLMQAQQVGDAMAIIKAEPGVSTVEEN